MADNTDKIDLKIDDDANLKNTGVNGSDLEIKKIDIQKNNTKKNDDNEIEINIKATIPSVTLKTETVSNPTNSKTEEEPQKDSKEPDENTNSQTKETSPVSQTQDQSKPTDDSNEDTQNQPEKDSGGGNADPTNQTNPLREPPKIDPQPQQTNTAPTPERSNEPPTAPDADARQNPPTISQNSEIPPTQQSESLPDSPPQIPSEPPILKEENQEQPRESTDGTPNKTPPAISKEQLGNIGPHSEPNTPPSVPAQDQKQTAANLNSDQAQINPPAKNNLAQRIGGGLKDKAQAGMDGLKNTPKNIGNNLKNSFQSDRSRKKQLGQQRRVLESELKKLENKISGVKGSLAMQIIRFWLPPLYSSIMGITFGIKNVQGQARIKMLQAKIASLETIHLSLQTAEVGGALTDATLRTFRFALQISAPTFFIGTLIVLILSPIIILFFATIMYILKKGGIVPAIEKIDKEIVDIKKDLEDKLKPEKQKVKIRQEIQKINQLMSADSQTRREQPNNQNTNEPQQAV